MDRSREKLPQKGKEKQSLSDVDQLIVSGAQEGNEMRSMGFKQMHEDPRVLLSGFYRPRSAMTLRRKPIKPGPFVLCWNT
jgi:hypothetical protein